MSNEFPPRRRDWQQGLPQVGAMLRTRMGSTISVSNDRATARQETLVYAIILDSGAQSKFRVPEEIMTKLTEWVDGQVKRSEL